MVFFRGFQKKMSEALSFDFEKIISTRAIANETKAQVKNDDKPLDPQVEELVKKLSRIEDLSLSIGAFEELDIPKAPNETVLKKISRVYDLYRFGTAMNALENASIIDKNRTMSRLAFQPKEEVNVYQVSKGDFIKHQIERTRYLKYKSISSLTLIHGLDARVTVVIDDSWTMPGRLFKILLKEQRIELQLKDFEPELYENSDSKKPRYATQLVQVIAKISDLTQMAEEFLSLKRTLTNVERKSHVTNWLAQSVLETNMKEFIVQRLTKLVNEDLQEFKTDPESDSEVIDDGKISVIFSDNPPYITVTRRTITRAKRTTGFQTEPEIRDQVFETNIMERWRGVESELVDIVLRLEVPIWSLSDNLEVGDPISGTISHFAFLPSDEVKQSSIFFALKGISTVSNVVVEDSVRSMRDGTIKKYPKDSHRFIVTDIPDGSMFSDLTRLQKFQFTNAIWSSKFNRFALLRGAQNIFDMDMLSRHIDVGLFLEDKNAKSSDFIVLTAKELVKHKLAVGPLWMNTPPSVRTLWFKGTRKKKKTYKKLFKAGQDLAAAKGEDFTVDHMMIAKARESPASGQIISFEAGALTIEPMNFPTIGKRVTEAFDMLVIPPKVGEHRFDREYEFLSYLGRVREAFVFRLYNTEYGPLSHLSGELKIIALLSTIFGEKEAYSMLFGPNGAVSMLPRSIIGEKQEQVFIEILARGFRNARFSEIFDPNDPTEAAIIESLKNLDPTQINEVDKLFEFMPYTTEVLENPDETDRLLELKNSALEKIKRKKKSTYENAVFDKIYLGKWWNEGARLRIRTRGIAPPVLSESVLHSLEYFIEEVGLLPEFASLEVWSRTRIFDAIDRLNTDTTGASESLTKFVKIIAKYGKKKEANAMRSVFDVLFIDEGIVGFEDNFPVFESRTIHRLITPSRARVARKFILQFKDRFKELERGGFSLPLRILGEVEKKGLSKTLQRLEEMERELLMLPKSEELVSRHWEQAIRMQFIMESFADRVIKGHLSLMKKELGGTGIPFDLLTYVSQYTTETEVNANLFITNFGDAITPPATGIGLEPVIRAPIKLGDIRESMLHSGIVSGKKLYVLLYQRVYWKREKFSALREAPLARRRVAKILANGEQWGDDEFKGYYSMIRFDFDFKGNLDKTKALGINGIVSAIVPNISLPAERPNETVEASSIKLAKSRFRIGRTTETLESLKLA